MEIREFLDPRAVVQELEGTNRKEVLEEACTILADLYPVLDVDEMVEALMGRERLGSTGTGEGVAIPHGRLGKVNRLIACFARSTTGVDFEALDSNPVHLFFLLFAPQKAAGIHLKVLAQVALLLNNPSVRRDLLSSKSRETLYEILVGKNNQGKIWKLRS